MSSPVPNGHARASSPEATRLFQALAVELEEGRGDPEELFAAHPVLEGELRGLYRGWLATDALFRSMVCKPFTLRPGPT